MVLDVGAPGTVVAVVRALGVPAGAARVNIRPVSVTLNDVSLDPLAAVDAPPSDIVSPSMITSRSSPSSRVRKFFTWKKLPVMLMLRPIVLEAPDAAGGAGDSDRRPVPELAAMLSSWMKNSPSFGFCGIA